jgi:BMFP domain-containing protein YqiC
MNQPFSVNELIDGFGKTVKSTIELVAKTSPLDIRTLETAVESGLDKIRDKLASDFELVKKTEYDTNVELLEVLKKQVDALEERLAQLEKESKT